MPTTQQLREQRANIWEQMKEVMDIAQREGRDLSGEERSKYDAAELDLDRLEVDITRQERHDQRAATLDTVDRSGVVAPDGTGASASDEDKYGPAFRSWMRHGANIAAEERAILSSGWVDGSELRAQGVATTAAGGYLVPPAFRAKIVEQMTFVAAMRQYAEVITTETGAALPWPTVDDTANEGAILGENTAATEQDVVFGQADIGAYMYTSKMVRVSFQLLQDNAFNLESWLGKALGARIGRIQNRHFTVGTGSSQPDGIVTSAPVGKVGATGQTTSIIYDDLVDLTDSIDPAYLGAGDMRFMTSQSGRKVFRKLKDSQGHPLWEPSLQVGTPDTLLGYGIVLNNNVPVPAASAKSLLFGNYSEAYLVRDVQGFQLLRLAERFAEFAQVGFIGFQRSDGTLQNASAVRAYQHPAT